MCPHRFGWYGKPFHIRIKRSLGTDKPLPHVFEILPANPVGKIRRPSDLTSSTSEKHQ